MALRILALDPATTTGFAYYDGKKDKKGEVYKNIQSGVWYCGETHLDESKDTRLLRLEANLNKIYEFGIDLVVFEAARNATMNSHRTLVVQGELQGLIKKWCMERNIPYMGVSPSEIKKHATGNGNANKDLMIDTAKKKYKVKKIETSDQADALCLVHMSIDLYGECKLFLENNKDNLPNSNFSS